jgi:predicted kinase
LLRENLRLTTTERVRKMIAALRFAETVRASRVRRASGARERGGESELRGPSDVNDARPERADGMVEARVSARVSARVAQGVLIILSGLPGAGKTTIAREVARATGAVHVRIDSIEQALRNAGWDVQAEGYRVAYAIAQDNLRVGRTVIADCVNPWPLTRSEWRAVAERASVACLEVEIVCSDCELHRSRVEARTPDIDGHALPTWADVLARDYQPWTMARLVIDTAKLDAKQSAELIVSRAGEYR